MTKKSSSIAEYISWLLQQYNEIKKQTSPPTLYRLIEIKKKEDNQYELSFQIIGKAAIFKTTPAEVLQNKEAIESFSSKDINIINQLIYKPLSTSRNKILGKSFSDKLNSLVFKIQSSDVLINEKTASVLSQDQSFIKNLSPQDAHTIGYAAAQEASEKGKFIIEAMRQGKRSKIASIKSILFNRKGSTSIRIEKEETDFNLEESAINILKDKETLNSLTPLEAATVGYFAAQESYISEKNLINKLRNKK